MWAMLLTTLALAASLALETPRLVVVISIDQFRTDYLTRYGDLYRPAMSPEGVGGFRYLMENGAFFVNAAYEHIPTETGPGHATIGTGAPPGIHGIVGNEWYAGGASVYCTADSSARDVLTGGTSASPRNLLVSTFVEEVEKATGGQAVTASLSLKDRAAILMAGRLADVVLWFNGNRLSWTTSTAYRPDGKLPSWIEAWNERRIPARSAGTTWNQSLPPAVYLRARPTTRASVTGEFGTSFPHRLSSDEGSLYNDWRMTPMANQYTLETAAEAVRAMRMGQDEVPDVLAVSLSANDYLGHAFGPDSPEALEMCVRTDAALSDFFRFLGSAVPGGLDSVAILLSSDHGVASVPEDEAALGLPSKRVQPTAMVKPALDALEEELGTADLFASTSGDGIYFDKAKLDQAETDEYEVGSIVRDALRSHPDVHAVYLLADFDEPWLDDDPLTRKVRRSVLRGRSADVIIIPRPGVFVSPYPTGTGHGTPWQYDSNVPVLLAGPWFKRGVFTDRCSPEDIAPTVCYLVGAQRPSGCQGNVIGLR
jgi:predicted AlkP superfamily pyrophosphatase or phosphodiesterase